MFFRNLFKKKSAPPRRKSYYVKKDKFKRVEATGLPEGCELFRVEKLGDEIPEVGDILLKSSKKFTDVYRLEAVNSAKGPVTQEDRSSGELMTVFAMASARTRLIHMPASLVEYVREANQRQLEEEQVRRRKRQPKG